ncbi:YveK family protein [Peribacillus sp. SCS-155]|uniref:YveK family protein n=1 Tax=Peribacillus sedimenti TaxID=3115297 RepID=UPI00390617DC
MEQTMNIRKFWSIIRGHILLIASIAAMGAGISWGLASYYVTPTYEASRQIVVNNTNPKQVVDYNTVMTNFQFANTYSDIIYSEVVLEKVIEDLGLNITAQDFSKQIKVTSKQESQVITITVKDSDYELAVDIVNKIANVFETQVLEMMKVDNVELFPPTIAKPDPQPVQPKPALITIVGLAAGLFIGLGTSFLLRAFSNTITSESDIEEVLHIPVMGIVSKVRLKDINLKSKANKEIVNFSHSKGLGG